jgi:hypothetical protein
MRFHILLIVIASGLFAGCGHPPADGTAGGDLAPDSIAVVGMGVEAAKAGRVARQVTRYIEAVGGAEAYSDLLLQIAAGPDPYSVAQAGAFLVVRGSVRLGKTSTDSLAGLRSNWIERFGCESTVGMSSLGEGRWLLMASMAPAELANFMDFQIETTLAVITEAGTVPEFDRDRLGLAYLELHSQLSATEQDRFVRFLEAPVKSTEDECWLQRRLWEQLPELPVEDARIILWQIATNKF